MTGVECTGRKIAQMVNDYLSTAINDGTIKVLSIPLVIALKAACIRRDMFRLGQLGFLGSSKWCSSTSTEHFEMLDTVKIGRVELVKCRRFIRDGLIRTMYKRESGYTDTATGGRHKIRT